MDRTVKRLRKRLETTLARLCTPIGAELTNAGEALTTALIGARTGEANLETALCCARREAGGELARDDETALKRTIVFEWLDAQRRRANADALATIHAALPPRHRSLGNAQAGATQSAEAIGHAVETAQSNRAEPGARKRLDTVWRAISAHSTGRRGALIDLARRAQAEIREHVRRTNAERETVALSVALAGLAGLDDNDAASLFRRACNATHIDWQELPDAVRRSACNLGEEAKALLSAGQLLDDGWIRTDDVWSPPHAQSEHPGHAQGRR